MDERDAADSVPPPSLKHRLWFGWCAVWGACTTALCSVMQIINHRRDPSPKTFQKWADRWGRWTLWGMRIRVEYRQDVALEADQPYVFAANHQNLVDILVLAAGLPHAFGFVAKAELSRVPFMGLAIRHSPSLFLDKSTPRRSMETLKAAGERIRNGTSVLVFPEGARSWQRALLPFHKGAFTLALEAGVPVVPVAILDAYRVMDERCYAARPGTVTVRAGTPISTAHMRRSEAAVLQEFVRERIQEMLETQT